MRDAATTSTKAKLSLARRLLDGRGVSASATEGERLLRELADVGELEAMTELMKLVANGKALETTLAECIAWLTNWSKTRGKPRN